MTAAIRPATDDDLPTLLELYVQLNPDDPMVSVEQARATWTAIVDTAGRDILVATIDDAVVGTIDVTVTPNFTRGARPVLIIENVVVDEMHRRRGVGRLLLAAAVEVGRSAGCYKAQLSADDPDAFEFYEANGFRAGARTYKAYLD